MLMMMRRRLACCTRDREISIDFDEPKGVMTFNGLEVCIINNESYENDSRPPPPTMTQGEGCLTDSYDYGASSCSSSKEIAGLTSSKWVPARREDWDSDEWDPAGSPWNSFAKDKPIYVNRLLDIETMKEKFAKLLLGEDVTGGSNGLSMALALSNAITNLAATIFGELWKLEPLSNEKKGRWKREMNWLVSPTKYMVELVPGKKQSGRNGCTLEIMTPRARADICMNLPALQKLDSLLIETLDSMASTEFWYAEGGSRAEGRDKRERKGKRWWLPSPRVRRTGLSDYGRKKLMNQARLVYQVLKAVKSINENVLAEMPVPVIIKDALPKSGKASLGEELYKVVLNSESRFVDDMIKSLGLRTEHSVLDCINKLEVAAFAWEGRIHEQENGKSPSRTSWQFVKDPIHELEKTEMLLDRAESLIRFLRAKYPNLPHSFLDATKVQYSKDVGHAILEGYSRVLGNLAFSILSRIQDVLREDTETSSPYSLPSTPASLPVAGSSFFDILGSPIVVNPKVRHSLFDRSNVSNVKQSISSSTTTTSDSEVPPGCDSKTSSVTTTPCRSRGAWCIRREPFSP